MKSRIFIRVLSVIFAVCTVMSMAACGAKRQQNSYEDVIDWEIIDWEGNNDTSKKITVYISNDMQDYYAPKIEAFENNSQYEVEVHWGGAGSGVKSDQTTAISTGNPPDLILGGDVHIENQKGFLLPLNKLIERDEAIVQPNDFLEGFLDSLSSGEGIYYLPTTFSVSLLMYNKTLFDEAQLDYPNEGWTFDDFVETGKKLTKYNEKGVATQWGNQTITEWWSQWYSMLTTDGGSLFNDEGYVTLNNEVAINALERWRSLAGVQGKSINEFPNKIGTHNGSDGGNLGNFAGGKVAMLYSTSAGQLMTFSNSVGLNFDIAPLPKSTVTGKRSGTELSITAYGIHKNSKNKKGAWELLKWLTNPRDDLNELAEFALPSARKSERDLLLSVSKEARITVYKNIEAIYDAVKDSQPLPRFAYFEEVTQQYLVPEINKLLEGRYSTVVDAVKAAERNANSYIQYRYKSDF